MLFPHARSSPQAPWLGWNYLGLFTNSQELVTHQQKISTSSASGLLASRWWGAFWWLLLNTDWSLARMPVQALPRLQSPRLGSGPTGTEALGQRDEGEAKNKVKENGESNTSCRRVQSGVKCQHFAARRFLCTCILVDKVSCAFFFFSLIWKACSAEKGIVPWECFIFKCFCTELFAFHQHFNHLWWVSPEKNNFF